MCGITGIVQKNNSPVNLKELNLANKIIQHRGPDADGTFFGANFAMAHRRLAILDLSIKGNQPMEYRGNTIAYNGEIYNYIEIRKILHSKGYSFSTQTDTEVILAAYDYWGTTCVQHFNGMWAFVIYDHKRNELFCSRDRFGIKPFYYTTLQEKFCFASEIKQFTTIEGWQAKLNSKRVFDFLAWSYHNHTTETFFEDVFQLEKGHNLVYDLTTHTFNINCYYHLQKKRFSPTASWSFDQSKTEFFKLLKDAINLRLGSNVKVGSTLSGGLDSSSIVCLINQIIPGQTQECISACFNVPSYDESPWIDQVSQHINISTYKILPTFEEMLEDLNHVIWHQDEPIISASVVAQYQVFRAAKEKNIVAMLEGQGADETLAGYGTFYFPFIKSVLKRDLLTGSKELWAYLNIHDTSIIKIFESTKRLLSRGKSKSFPWLKFEFIEQSGHQYSPSRNTSIQQMTLNHIYESALSQMLHNGDRNAMAFSIESRLPFLDYRLVEFIFNLPDHFKIQHGKRKYILREALKPLLPSKIYNRYDKMGFSTPQEVWTQQYRSTFQKELEKVVDISNGIITPDIFNVDDYRLKWRAISFARWLEIFELTL